MQKISTTHNLIRFYFGECSHEEEKLILGDLREIGLDTDQLSDETKITGLKAEITSN
jgi:hypothetical protein